MTFQSIKNMYWLLSVDNCVPNFGKSIRQLREEAKLSRPKAAALMCVPPTSLKNHERGVRVGVSAERALNYLMALSPYGKEHLLNNIRWMIEPDTALTPRINPEGHQCPSDWDMCTGNYAVNLRVLRRQHGSKSRTQFGNITGICRVSLKNYELNYSKVPFTAIVKLAITTSNSMEESMEKIDKLLDLNSLFRNVP